MLKIYQKRSILKSNKSQLQSFQVQISSRQIKFKKSFKNQMKKIISPQQQKHQLPSTLLYIIFILRISIIFIPLNYDYPDEYWQGPQIAYKIYNQFFNENRNIGIQTWQWTIDDPIRNPVYQYFLTLGYVIIEGIIRFFYVLQQHFGILGTTLSQQIQDKLIQTGPKLVQSLLAILGDIFMVKLLILNFNNITKKTLSIFELTFLLTNWFYFSMLSRTYINSFQCILTTIAFYYWQLHYLSNQTEIENKGFLQITSKNDTKSRFIVLLAYVSRPTSLIPWMIIWPFEMIDQLLKLREKEKETKEILKKSAQIIAKNFLQIFIMIFTSFIIGSLYYQKLTLTEWNFFYVNFLLTYFLGIYLFYFIQYNVLLKWSSFFQIHSFHFYFTQSLPFMEVGYLLFLIIGLYNGFKWPTKINKKSLPLQEKLNQSMFITICMMTIIFLIIQTLISQHKQHRFLLIFEPFFMIVKFKGFLVVKNYFSTYQKKGSKVKIFCCILGVIFLINLFMFWSVALYPKGGFNLLREVRKSIIKNQKIGLMYLCESHALPAYSIILRDISIVLRDESPMAKMNNQSQIELLKQNPQEIYNKFMRKIQFYHNNQPIDVKFIILQHKFFKVDRNQKNGQKLSQNWRFIEKYYKLKKVQKNRNFWQQLIFGPDYLYLYERK